MKILDKSAQWHRMDHEIGFAKTEFPQDRAKSNGEDARFDPGEPSAGSVPRFVQTKPGHVSDARP